MKRKAEAVNQDQDRKDKKKKQNSRAEIKAALVG